MDNEDIQTAISVLKELKNEYDFESDEYADVSQTIHYLKMKQN